MSTEQLKPLKIHIEYCGVCHLEKACSELAEKIRNESEGANVVCQLGRQGSFEININDQLVYSKLKTMALPDYEEVLSTVKNASNGGPLNYIKKEQPITCVIS